MSWGESSFIISNFASSSNMVSSFNPLANQWCSFNLIFAVSYFPFFCVVFVNLCFLSSRTVSETQSSSNAAWLPSADLSKYVLVLLVDAEVATAEVVSSSCHCFLFLFCTDHVCNEGLSLRSVSDVVVCESLVASVKGWK